MAEGCKVHIGGLDRDKETPKEEIEREFSRFQESGDVNVWVARKPPGFAFVTFTDARDAEDACKELNGKSLFGQENVTVAISQTRGRGGGGSGYRGGGGGGGDGGYGRDRYDERRDHGRRSPPRGYARERSSYDYDDRGGGGRSHDDRRDRGGYDRGSGYDSRRSPPRGSGRDRRDSYGDRRRSPPPRRRERSRSRSPPRRKERARSRSPAKDAKADDKEKTKVEKDE